MLEEVVNKMVEASDKELINWLISLCNYGELREEMYVVYLGCLKRGGETSNKAQYIYKHV